MDARSTESDLIPATGWLARERESGRFYRLVGIGSAIALAGTMLATIAVVRKAGEPGTLFSPPLIALLLIANLLPAIVLMVMIARGIARQSAARRGLGTGQLHTRLVALFSIVAAVPTVVVAIFASILLQSGLEFWFSNRARTMLENTVEVARGTRRFELNRVGGEAVAMSGDVARALNQMPLESDVFQKGVAVQTYQRSLNEAAMFRLLPDGEVQALALVNPYDDMLNKERISAAIRQLGTGKLADAQTPDRLAVITPVDYGKSTYLYASRWLDPEVEGQINRANEILSDYQALLARSRSNQLRFNIALYFGALLIVGLAILTALKLADRLVQPVGALVDAAGRIEEGDFAVRVPVREPADELATLGAAFNRMTGRLEEQTGALIAANSQLDTRRAFIEAVLSSVTAGVVTVDRAGSVVLTNRSAQALLEPGGESIEGRELARISPELAEFLAGEARDATVLVAAGSGQRTLAVKRVRYGDSTVLTFDDITEQLSDQRRAAWSDIARRIAHEIKNPLTPISLAAERLQRRYGPQVTSDRDTFDRLTATIVRQVGDLRRMVDEFSNFARMPKPVFRDVNVHEIARNALFLHEVAHPEIEFSLDPPDGDIRLVGDRRQLAQALTNIVKNGIEAIEARRIKGIDSPDGDRIALRMARQGDQLVIDVTDTGIGLPEDRERLTEPYMTTRVRGTGLGLAIVKKIVEEHHGDIAFLDRPGGGTHVRVAFDAERLASLAGSGEEKAGEGAPFADAEPDEFEEPA